MCLFHCFSVALWQHVLWQLPMSFHQPIPFEPHIAAVFSTHLDCNILTPQPLEKKSALQWHQPTLCILGCFPSSPTDLLGLKFFKRYTIESSCSTDSSFASLSLGPMAWENILVRTEKKRALSTYHKELPHSAVVLHFLCYFIAKVAAETGCPPCPLLVSTLVELSFSQHEPCMPRQYVCVLPFKVIFASVSFLCPFYINAQRVPHLAKSFSWQSTFFFFSSV